MKRLRRSREIASGGARARAEGGGGAPAAPLRLLDAKAEQRAAIALARVRLGDAAIVEAVLACDADALAPARLELVLRAAPSDAEAAAALAVAPGDAPRLSRASQFHRALAARVPDAARRLEGLSFAQRVEQSTRNLNDDFRVLARACEQIGRSERLARLLERVLALGNALNAGSARGGARVSARTSNVRRSAPSTWRRLRDCVCSTMWTFHAVVEATTSP